MTDLADEIEALRHSLHDAYSRRSMSVSQLDAEHAARNADLIAQMQWVGGQMERRHEHAIAALRELAEVMRIALPEPEPEPLPTSPPPLPKFMARDDHFTSPTMSDRIASVANVLERFGGVRARG